MFQVSQSLEIDRAAVEVWPYLIAFEQVPLWEHGVAEVRQITPGRPRIGTEISARRVFGGREASLAGRIVAFNDGVSVTMSLRGGPIDEAIVEYEVAAVGDRRSVVTYRASGDLIRPLRILHPILPRLGRAEAAKNLAKLKRRIESGIPPHDTRTSVPRGDRR